MNKTLVPVLSVIAVAAIAFAFIKSNGSASQDQLAALNAELAAQRKALNDAINKSSEELASLKENNERLKRERDDAKARAKELAENAEKNAGIAEATPAAPRTGEQARQDLRSMAAGFMRTIGEDPEVRKMMREGGAQQINRFYDATFKKLGLSEQDSQVVAELINERNFAALDASRKLMEGKPGDEAAMAAVRKEIETTKASYDAKIKGVVGEQAFTELNTFEQTAGDQRTLDGIARSLERKQAPLEPAQRDALANIMREERLKNPTNEIPDLGGGPGMAVLYGEAELKERQQQEDAYQQRVLSRASQAGLNPDQVNGLQDSFKERNQRQAQGRVWGRAFLGGGNVPTAPPK